MRLSALSSEKKMLILSSVESARDALSNGRDFWETIRPIPSGLAANLT
jgi:hypothetical protein